VDAETHDRVVAYVSHLPQLLAVALMETAGAAVGESGLALSGPALPEMTRLASSPPDLWRGILASNADFVAEAAAALAGRLPSSQDEIRTWSSVEALFDRARSWRAAGERRNENRGTVEPRNAGTRERRNHQ
jgi:prephenate dehydrogenase